MATDAAPDAGRCAALGAASIALGAEAAVSAGVALESGRHRSAAAESAGVAGADARPIAAPPSAPIPT